MAAEIIELEVQTAAKRLDAWLSLQLPSISRSRLQKLIEQGQVQLNQTPCLAKKASLQVGDKVIVTLPPPKPLDVQPQDIPLDILYEDEEMIILNKPAGMVVHPAPGHSDGTLVNALLYHCDRLAGIGGVERPGIVHRLDKDTTGAIAIAKTDFAHQALQKQIQSKTAYREYLGVVYGRPGAAEGTVNQPVGRHGGDRKKMAIIPVEKGGRVAITHWQILETLGNYTLMRYQLETGRTHQIRVHSAFLGHPIVGDTVYGSSRSLKVNLTGQALHARKLRLYHPRTEKLIEAIAPLPQEFSKLLEVLRGRAFQ
ncbi:MAG: RluA family pseudouridine synthase [Jaaginema sp. PMC 1079.18]|nr:RluA family pseudouridine synthase [Jaaginema sp. PMC 1080.18]MEC4851158.1 RluA family pseudouridine synthase [Jaaginema sp. PMC 1079.18]MEC4867043.1 RluA family pseudouridine synthase [Jaaginema sp. PMC 1078.18]